LNREPLVVIVDTILLAEVWESRLVAAVAFATRQPSPHMTNSCCWQPMAAGED
jgi:hypothetical protein